MLYLEAMAEYMNIAGVCTALDVSRETFYRKHRKNLPDPTKFVGKRALHWKAADVRRYAKDIARFEKAKGLK
jgi:predicted DNA-binding transcriptional regulator AlpA